MRGRGETETNEESVRWIELVDDSRNDGQLFSLSLDLVTCNYSSFFLFSFPHEIFEASCVCGLHSVLVSESSLP